MTQLIQKYYENGKIKELGYMNNDKREGEWIVGEYIEYIYYLTKKNYIGGVLNGYYKYSDEDKYNTEEGNYIDGKKNGLWVKEYAKTFRIEELYKNDIIQNLKGYKGNKLIQENYYYNNKDYRFTRYKNNKIIEQGIYINEIKYLY